MIGLCDAAKRFDPARGVPFTTFAYLRIIGAVRDGLRVIDHLSRTQRRKAKAGEIVAVGLASLDRALAGADSGNGHELLGLPDAELIDPAFWAAATKGLSPTERTAIVRYFRDGLTMRQVGDEIGYSESRISQIVSSVLARLRGDTGIRERLLSIC